MQTLTEIWLGVVRMTDVFRTPDERFADLPGFPYEPHYAEVDGLRLHHLDEGSGPTVLCFHGEPSWSYLYRHMLDALVAAGNRVVCPDLVGFGRSDKPTDEGWYTYDRHVDTVAAHSTSSTWTTSPSSSRTGAARSACAGPSSTPTGWSGWSSSTPACSRAGSARASWPGATSSSARPTCPSG